MNNYCSRPPKYKRVIWNILIILYVVILAKSIIGCTGEKYRPMPKVGECFERFDAENSPDGYELVKIIDIHFNDDISYVYNFPNEPGFKKGQWYHLKTLNRETKNWFYRSWEKFEAVKPIKCPF